jgi:hypothetical protein
MFQEGQVTLIPRPSTDVDVECVVQFVVNQEGFRASIRDFGGRTDESVLAG